METHLTVEFAARVLLISFIGPLGLPVAAATKITLSLMHLIAAVAIVGVLAGLSQTRIEEFG